MNLLGRITLWIELYESSLHFVEPFIPKSIFQAEFQILAPSHAFVLEDPNTAKVNTNL